MLKGKKGAMKEAKPYVYVTASQTIHNTPCMLYSLIVNPDGSNASYVEIYDGENTTEPKALKIRIQADHGHVFPINPPLKLKRGLRVEFGANLESVTISSEALKD